MIAVCQTRGMPTYIMNETKENQAAETASKHNYKHGVRKLNV